MVRIITYPEYLDGKEGVHARHKGRITQLGRNEYLEELSEEFDTIINNQNINILENFERHPDRKILFKYGILRNTLWDIVNIDKNYGRDISNKLVEERNTLAKIIEKKVIYNPCATYKLIEDSIKEEKEETKRKIKEEMMRALKTQPKQNNLQPLEIRAELADVSP